MSPAGVLFATFAVLMLLGSPITVALGVAAMARPLHGGPKPRHAGADRLHLGQFLSHHGLARLHARRGAHGMRGHFAAACRHRGKHRRPHPRRARRLHRIGLRVFRGDFRFRPRDDRRRGDAYDPGHDPAGIQQGLCGCGRGDRRGRGHHHPPEHPDGRLCGVGAAIHHQNVPRRGNARHHDCGGGSPPCTSSSAGTCP